jgi:hypothetical protein
MSNYKSFAEIKEEFGSNYDFKLYEAGISALKKIERLQQENKQLKSILKSKPDTEITLQDDKENKFVLIQSERIDMQEKLNKTIERLLNNWNELKKLLNQKYYNGERIDTKDILDKMQELEQGSDE